MRNAGLDVARSAAIVLVLTAHSSFFFHGQFNIDPLLVGLGYFGVELFFALSGFLIGSILLRDVAPEPRLANLTRFWTRRWLRTLPAYYLVWLVLYRLSSGWPVTAPHLLFLQNWFPVPRDTFFGVSWSLAIEEWFYFSLPLLIVALRTRLDTRSAVLFICVAGIVICPLARLMYVDLPWGDMRKAVFIRMDAILYGILLAWARTYAREWFSRTAEFGKFSAIMLIVLWAPFFVRNGLETTLGKTIYFSMVSALMLPIIARLSAAQIPLRLIPVFKFVSVTSYSVYLIHWDVMTQFRILSVTQESASMTLLMLAICFVTIYAIAFLLYSCWERPWMALRDDLSSAKRKHALFS